MTLAIYPHPCKLNGKSAHWWDSLRETNVTCAFRTTPIPANGGSCTIQGLAAQELSFEGTSQDTCSWDSRKCRNILRGNNCMQRKHVIQTLFKTLPGKNSVEVTAGNKTPSHFASLITMCRYHYVYLHRRYRTRYKSPRLFINAFCHITYNGVNLYCHRRCTIRLFFIKLADTKPHCLCANLLFPAFRRAPKRQPGRWYSVLLSTSENNPDP